MKEIKNVHTHTIVYIIQILKSYKNETVKKEIAF